MIESYGYKSTVHNCALKATHAQDSWWIDYQVAGCPCLWCALGHRRQSGEWLGCHNQPDSALPAWSLHLKGVFGDLTPQATSASQVYSFIKSIPLGFFIGLDLYIYILYRYLQQLRRSIPLHQRELSCVWRNKIFFEPSSSMKTTPWKLLGKVACGSPLSRPSVRSARKYQFLEICEAVKQSLILLLMEEILPPLHSQFTIPLIYRVFYITNSAGFTSHSTWGHDPANTQPLPCWKALWSMLQYQSTHEIHP